MSKLTVIIEGIDLGVENGHYSAAFHTYAELRKRVAPSIQSVRFVKYPPKENIAIPNYKIELGYDFVAPVVVHSSRAEAQMFYYVTGYISGYKLSEVHQENIT